MLYTICATCPQAAVRPCAIVDAVGQKDAIHQALEMERVGILLFLPRPRTFSARKATIPEVEAWRTWMRDADGATPGGTFDPSWGPARRRRAEIFHQKLWMGEIELRAPARR